jgi:hypothetical protein
MESVRTESTTKKHHHSMKKLYFNIPTLLGKFIGRSRDKQYWWHPTEEARKYYPAIKKELQNQLNNANLDTCGSSCHFDLFMIGLDELSAKPTIMFFGGTEKLREKMIEIVDESGILQQFPQYCTGHRAKQPSFGEIIQTAGDVESGDRAVELSSTRVYYDPFHEVRAIGMSIFVQQENGDWRRATAYRVFKDEQCFLMSVAHVFNASMSTDIDDISDDDSEFEYASDAGSGFGDDDQTTDIPSTRDDGSSASSEMLYIGDDTISKRQGSGKAALSKESEVFEQSNATSQSDRFQPLGYLYHPDVNEDWALISIDSETVLSELMNDHTAPTESYVGEIAKGTRGMVCIADQQTQGTFSESTPCIRLPGSSVFRDVYAIELNDAINWGDCGALCMDLGSRRSYGHIVASSENMRIVFVVPAVRVLELSRTTWKSSEYKNITQEMETKRLVEINDQAAILRKEADLRREEEERRISKLAHGDQPAALRRESREVSQKLTGKTNEEAFPVRTETTSSSSSPWIATFADESHSGPEAENSRVSTVTTTPEWSFKSLWKQKAKSTPEMQASVGTLVGNFNQESWWMATGKALEDFKSIQEVLIELLRDEHGDSTSILHYELFMIGKDPMSAKPTIMFFCEEANIRREAKNLVDKVGILKRLPGFRTGHARKRPGISNLVIP